MATPAPDSSVVPSHLPWFVTGPGQTDGLMVASVILVVATVFALGVLFFWLHSLPERLGHKKLQFEIVAVLALLSLFTHNHLFWVIGLMLALVDLPDIMTPFRRIADSVETMSATRAPAPDASSATEASKPAKAPQAPPASPGHSEKVG
jgi:hypothetical protein